MEHILDESLAEIEKELMLMSESNDSLNSVGNKLINFLKDMERNGDRNKETEYLVAISILEKLIDKVPKECDYYQYLLAFRDCLDGDYNGYLEHIELYLEKRPKNLDIEFEEALYDFLEIIELFPSGNPFVDNRKEMSKFRAIIKRLFPDSAFERYLKYWLSETDNYEIQKKHLLEVIEKDSKWLFAYLLLGNIFYNQNNWQESKNYYEKAIESSDIYKNADLYFYLAYACGKLKFKEKEQLYYRKCLEIDPNFEFANNNLGYCLSQQKLYVEAIDYFDKSIALKTDGHYPFRNKFDALKKLGQCEAALQLIQDNTMHFNTKHFKAEVDKMSSGCNKFEDVFAKLNEVTESNFAGELIVADSNSGISLYPHQRDAILAMNKKALGSDNFAGLLVLPTGGGKTLTATYWLMESLLDKGKKIIWIAHRHELLNQAQKSFEKVCFKDISRNHKSYSWRIVSGQHDKPIHIKKTDDIIIASKTSLMRGANYFLQNWLQENGEQTILIIDEAHHAVASEYRELISMIRNNCDKFHMLGLTATPFRTDESEKGLLKKLFTDGIVYKIDLRELINRGILSEPIFKSVSTNINMAELFESNHSEEALERMVNEKFFDIESIGKETAAAIANNKERNHAIVDEYIKNRGVYKQTLVFALNVDMAIVLSGLFQAHGVKADFVVSDVKDNITGVTISSEENAQKIEKFRNGELDVLVNVNILTEGTDLPSVQSVFLTRPTKSKILMTQMIGRALRGEQAGGTKEAYIVSFIDNWADKIAWVNPEQLYIDENIDFSKKDHEAQKMGMRLVSIAKIEEFAKIANETVDDRLAEMPFIERIPIGLYKFSYLTENANEDEVDKYCNILVYDCMKDAYEQLMHWLPTANLCDIERAANHADETLFNSLDLLMGYEKQDIIDLMQYYKQTQDIPEMITLSERSNYDIAYLARYILEKQLAPAAKKEYIDNEWNKGDKHWAAFMGIENQKAFRKLIDAEIDRLENPDDYAKPTIKPITEKEKIKVQQLPLYEIRKRFPELEEKIRDAVFKKFTDAEGYYYSAKGGYRSKNRIDFQIDHIVPMSHGGMSVVENLQLLTVAENKIKSDNC